jgi:DNA-binding NarL/FixJ family response regulator
MTTIRICGAIASKTGVTLFLEGGDQMVLAKDSYRTGEIVRAAMPFLAEHKVAVIDLDTYTAHAILEKKSGGFMRFIAEKLKGVLTGRVDAVVDGKTIPNVQRLEKHIERAAYGESYKGFEVFMTRLAAIIDARGHTVDELLNFMEKGDLPIADDGSIVAYKVLKSHTTMNMFVDCHTSKVTQQVGSLVSMPLEDVDESRRTECSTGLHVARRGYLRSFSGDVMTLIKVAPEDVVAVPQGEPDKMRVRAYHIVAQLSSTAARLLREGKPMTTDDASAKILAAVIAGDHVGILEEVSITRAKGEGLRITVLDTDGQPLFRSDHTPVKALDDGDVEKKVVPISEIQQTVRAAAAKAKVNAAAVSGDLSAALSVEPENKPAETPPAAKESAPKKKRKAPVAPAPAAPAVDPVQKDLKPLSELPETHREALKLIAGGMSQRDVARKVTICRKTLRKLIRAGYAA